jgi:hypothetical protein
LARHLKYPPSLEALDAEPSPKRRKRRPAPNPKALERATEKASVMMAEFQKGDRHAFDSAKASELVGLYSLLHALVYGVRPEELAVEWTSAVAAARRQLVSQFDGRPSRLVAFLRWTWKRESKREKKRRSNGASEVYRVGWRLQFGNSLLTDYRVAVARRGGKVRT